MKVLFTIFAVYLLQISMFAGICEDLSASKTATNSSTIQKNPDNTSDEDNCSPFCQCMCCGLTISLTHILQSSIKGPEAIEIKFPSLEKSSILETDSEFWQPPKIS